jgi:hypothetical protein
MTPSTYRIVHSEVVGATKLTIVERTDFVTGIQRYSIERVCEGADGESVFTLYGTRTFPALADALAFGREWCLGAAPRPAQGQLVSLLQTEASQSSRNQRSSIHR